MAIDEIVETLVKKCGGFLEKLERESPNSHDTFLRDTVSFDPFKEGKQASLDLLRHVVLKSQPNFLKHFREYLQQPETTSTDDDEAEIPEYLRVKKNKSTNYGLVSDNIPRDNVLNHSFYELLPPTDMNFASRKRSRDELDKHDREDKLFEEDQLPVRLKWAEETLDKAASSGPKAAQYFTPNQLELIKDQIKEMRLTRNNIRKLTHHGLTHLAHHLTHRCKESKLQLVDRAIQSRLRWRNSLPLTEDEKEDRILDNLSSTMKTMKFELNFLSHPIPNTRRSYSTSTVYNNRVQAPHPVPLCT